MGIASTARKSREALGNPYEALPEIFWLETMGMYSVCYCDKKFWASSCMRLTLVVLDTNFRRMINDHYRDATVA